jgi:hypothetical protein
MATLILPNVLAPRYTNNSGVITYGDLLRKFGYKDEKINRKRPSWYERKSPEERKEIRERNKKYQREAWEREKLRLAEMRGE